MKKTKNIIGYKAFDKGLICRGYQYEVGKEHVEDVIPKICDKGFHFCKNPLDTLNYYDITKSEFALVEATGDVSEGEDKVSTNKLLVKAKIDF